jgi:hypothetical protein
MSEQIFYLDIIYLGDPALLHHMIVTEKIEISKLKDMDRSSLEHLCDRCGIKTSGKSMVC